MNGGILYLITIFSGLFGLLELLNPPGNAAIFEKRPQVPELSFLLNSHCNAVGGHTHFININTNRRPLNAG